LFYTDPDARAAYQRFVRHLLQHRNAYTGLRYVDDPTIMAWELGNELNGMTPDWVQDNAAYVKKLAPRQLVAAGKQFGVDPAVLSASAVDISDSHYYPPNADGISADAQTVTDAGKVYIAGEFGSPSATAELLDAVAANPDVSGATYWSLFPHADHYGYVQHDDGFTLHAPGDDEAMQDRVAALSAFAADMSGKQVGRVVGDAPLISAVDKTAGLNAVAWRGTAGADGYLIQRSVLGGDWKTVSGADPISANDAPWLDRATVAASTRYRVRAVDGDGTVLATSAPAAVARTSAVTVDPLEDWFVADGHSRSLRRAPSRSGVEVAPAAGKAGWIEYRTEGLIRAEASVVSDRRPRPTVRVLVADRWRTVIPLVTRSASGDWTVAVSGLSGVRAVRLAWAETDRWALTRVSITDRAEVPAEAPGAFTLTTPTPGTEGVSTQTPITWSAASDTAYYDLAVSEHADLSDPLVSVSGLTGTSYAPTTAWPGGTRLYVRVTAVNGVGTTAVTGDPVSFTTRAATPGVLVDDFDTYADDAALQAAWVRNSGGDPITPTLGEPGEGSGHSMVLGFGTGPSGYAGVIRTLPSTQDWRGTSGLRLWVKPGRDGQRLGLQFTAKGSYWEHQLELTGTEGRVVVVPWADFAPPPWAPQDAVLDLSSVTNLALYPDAQSSQDTITIDSVSATP
jgi:mannan endo-1,4-beta-mannosidase